MKFCFKLLLLFVKLFRVCEKNSEQLKIINAHKWYPLYPPPPGLSNHWWSSPNLDTCGSLTIPTGRPGVPGPHSCLGNGIYWTMKCKGTNSIQLRTLWMPGSVTQLNLALNIWRLVQIQSHTVLFKFTFCHFLAIMSYLPSFYFCCLMCKRAMGNNCDTCLTGPLGELHWLTHVKPLEKCLARSEDSINANLVNSSSTWRYCSPKVLYQQAGNFTSDLVVRFLVSII